MEKLTNAALARKNGKPGLSIIVRQSDQPDFQCMQRESDPVVDPELLR